MRLINIDLGVLSLVGEFQDYNNEIVLCLGSKLPNSRLDDRVVLDKCILDDFKSNKEVKNYGVGGVQTPLIGKEGVDYIESNILFTGKYSSDGLILTDELVLYGPKGFLSNVKVIAGGHKPTCNATDGLNLVLKIPKECYYGVGSGRVLYDENDNVLSDMSMLEKATLRDVLLSCKVLPPRGVFNKKLYRHFKGKWYLVEGVGGYVDHDITLVAYREMYGNCRLHFREKDLFTAENHKKAKYPLQDFRYMTLAELEYSLGEDSEEYRAVLIEYNKLINEHPFIIGL